MKSLTMPLKPEDLKELTAGEEVLLQGPMLVGRDQAHFRLCQSLDRGEGLPLSLEGETIYYMGPAPTPPGEIVGSAGPTTAKRMDPFVSPLLEQGLRGMVGKGPRSEEVRLAIEKAGVVYFAAFGGCGALYAQCIYNMETLAYEDLGPEAIFRIEVKDFPVVVAMDSRGGSIF